MTRHNRVVGLSSDSGLCQIPLVKPNFFTKGKFRARKGVVLKKGRVNNRFLIKLKRTRPYFNTPRQQNNEATVVIYSGCAKLSRFFLQNSSDYVNVLAV